MGGTVIGMGCPGGLQSPMLLPRVCSPSPCQAGLLWVSEATCDMLAAA